MDKNTPQNRVGVAKRLTNLLLVIGGVALCLNLWLFNQTSHRQTQQAIADQLGESLLGVSQKSLAIDMAADDRLAIDQLVTFVTEDPQVESAAVYRLDGTLISESDSNMPIVGYYRRQMDDNPRVYVAEVQHNGVLLGYIRLILNEDAVMQHHQSFRMTMIEQAQFIFVLGIALGVLVARTYYNLKAKRHTSGSVLPQRIFKRVRLNNRR